jgi:hypothetical protein
MSKGQENKRLSSTFRLQIKARTYIPHLRRVEIASIEDEADVFATPKGCQRGLAEPSVFLGKLKLEL